MKSLGERMKSNYESRQHFHLTRRTPVIMRLDGRAFHTLTRKCEKPFDDNLNRCVCGAAQVLCADAQGAKIAYIQSDEMSILLTDFDQLDTQAWFDYDLQKLVSISSALVSVSFNKLWASPALASFDCRAFNIPKEEVANYFVWRQKDWTRNSVQLLAQAHFSHKQLQGKGQPDMHDMLHDKGVNWADLSPKWKNGTIITRSDLGWIAQDAPIFTENRDVIERYLYLEEDKDEISDS